MDRLYSYILVSIQFLSLGAMVFFDYSLLKDPFALTLLIIGLGVGLYAIYCNKKFNIIPEINEEACLVTHGIYRYVRHPMYFSLLVAFFGFFLLGSLVTKALYIILIIVLYLKARKEERLWHCKDDAYADYKRQTKMFIPFYFINLFFFHHL